MDPEARIEGPVASGKSETMIKAITRKATRPSEFIDETQEESPES